MFVAGSLLGVWECNDVGFVLGTRGSSELRATLSQRPSVFVQLGQIVQEMLSSLATLPIRDDVGDGSHF